MVYDTGLGIKNYYDLRDKGMTNSNGSQKTPTPQYIASSVVDGLGSWIVENWQVALVGAVAILVLIKD